MISRAAGDAGREKNMSQNIIESSENLEPWNMFTLNLVTPKTEPDDSFEPEIVVPEKDAFSVYLTSSAEGQSSEFIIPKIEPVNPGSDEESSCKMDCSTFEPKEGDYCGSPVNEVTKGWTDGDFLDQEMYLTSDLEDDLDSNSAEDWLSDEEEEDDKDEDDTIIVVPKQAVPATPEPSPPTSENASPELYSISGLWKSRVFDESSAWSPDPRPAAVIPFSGNPGLRVVPDSDKPIDYFLLLFSDEILHLILDATNCQALVLSSQNVSPKARIRGWKALTRADFEVFLGLFYMTGQVHAPSYEHYWQNNLLYNYPLFRNAMGRDRFLLILRALYFAKHPGIERKQFDPLRRIQPLLDLFQRRMDEIYYPCKELSLGGSMMLSCDRLDFRSNEHKCGIKFYVLTQTNGLILKTKIRCGSDRKLVGGPGHVDQVTRHLLQDYIGVGHAVYMDSYYSTAGITEYLLDQKTYTTGSLKANRKGNPFHVVNKKLKPGEVEAAYTQKGICVLKWRNHIVISSEFGASRVEHKSRSGKVVQTPEAVLKYKMITGGLDQAEQLMAYYPNQRTSLRCYTKVGIHILHIIMNNAFLLHKKFSRGKKLKLLEFRNQVITSLICRHRTTLGTVMGNADTFHTPKAVPRNDKNRKLLKRCVVCRKSGVLQQSGYLCSACPKQPGLCLGRCFARYHNYEEP